MAKKEFMGYCKGIMPRICKKLTENGKEDRVAAFKAGATEMVKFIISKYDEFQFFTGPSFDMDAGMAFAYQKEQDDEGPTFLFFLDNMSEMKL